MNETITNNPVMRVSCSEEFLRDFYRSKEWSTTRGAFLLLCRQEKRLFACSLCSSELFFRSSGPVEGKKPLNVDHILPVRYYPELRLDITNLQLLCEECNRTKASMCHKEDIEWHIQAQAIQRSIIAAQKPVVFRDDYVERPKNKKYIPPVLIRAKSPASGNFRVTSVIGADMQPHKVYTIKKK
jgi:hypothetical protein